MNITLSADDKLIKKSRSYASRHKTSINKLIRDYLNDLSGEKERMELAEEFAELATKHAGCSPEGFKFNREDAHDRGGE